MKVKSPYIIIDASSYINLSAFEYRFGTLLTVLAEAVTLRYSATVNQEVAHHWDNKLPDSLSRSSKIHYPKKYTLNDYEKWLFDQISQSSKDKGEKHNFAVALDLFLTQKRSNLVFLIDDDTALAGPLKQVKQAFPIIKIWNSFDVVLYLYLLKSQTKPFPYETAQAALQTLHGKTTSHNPQTNAKKTKARHKKLRNYQTYLDRIKMLDRRH